MQLGQLLRQKMTAPSFDALLVEKLQKMSERVPEGVLLQTMAQMFGGVALLVPMLKPLLVLFVEEVVGGVVAGVDVMEVVSVQRVRQEVCVLYVLLLLLVLML